MTNIILTGAAGRMGRAVLNVLPNFSGLHLVGAVDVVGHPQIGKAIFRNIKLSSDLAAVIKGGDVLIDFTSAESSVTNLKMAISAGMPVVICATGHNEDQKAEINALSKKAAIVFSPNLSVGVNVMWELIKKTAAILGKEYQIDIVETHHIHKKDAPSGTAKKILEVVAASGGYNLNKDVFFHMEGSEMPEGKKIKVKSIREGEVVGDHTIVFTSPYERLEITHRAFSREVFAAGALRAASWIIGKKAGLYDMGDVLAI